MLPLLSWFLVAMAAGGGLHTNSVTAEVTIASNSAVVRVYWHTMLPNSPMPPAILELLTTPSGITEIDETEKCNSQQSRTTTNDFQKSNPKWGPSLWGPTTTNDLEKSNPKWGPTTTNDFQESKPERGPTKTDGFEKSYPKWGPSLWGPTTTNDLQKSNPRWGPTTTNDFQTSNPKWGPSLWGSTTTNDLHKNNPKWGPSLWGPTTTNDFQMSNPIWGPSTKGEEQKGDQKDVPLEMGESYVGRDNQKHGTMSDMVFLEESLKPGSTITCYIQPSSTSGSPLLRREVADSIPISTKNFMDILTFFAPMSDYMAADIWSTLEFCEHPRAIKGETKMCATSVESMVEFVASVLGVSTYNLQAFSSPDVPVEAVMNGRGYKVVAAKRVTQTGDTVTCHGLRFPFAIFMCHAVNPTRVYSVTLDGEDVGPNGAGQRMEVLAVCHLDTSEFDPAKMPVHVKPGDAPLCHFLSRDSILFAPTRPASGHVNA